MVLLASCFTPLLAPPQAQADALRDVERTTSGGGGDDDRSSDRAARPSTERDDDDDWDGCAGDGCGLGEAIGWAIGYAFYKVVSAPWAVPRRFDQPCLEHYAAYPGAEGPALLRTGDRCFTAVESGARRTAVDVELESGFQFEGVVPASFAMRAHLPRRFELSVRLSLLSDVYELPAELAMASQAHVGWRHAQTARAEFRTALGVRFFALNEPRAGIDIMYAVDSYLARRGVFRLELHLGSLGNALAGEVRATIGVTVARVEFYTGYDHTTLVGNGKTTLGGPVAGVRAWF